MQQTDDTGSSARQIQPRYVVVATLVALLVALVAVVTVGSLPSACAVCHERQIAAMDSAPHSSSDCYDCHLDDGAWGFAEEKNAELVRMYPAALLGKGMQSPVRTIGRAACLECHAEVLKGITTGDGLSIKHTVCAPDPTCDGCHSMTAHGTTVRWKTVPVMEDCVACHERAGVSLECETCHTSEPDVRRDVKGPWQVTHGPNWKKTHGMGDQGSCSTCHPDGFCAQCHRVPVPHPQDFGATHGGYAVKDEAACVTCHKSKEKFCDACHTVPMPHPDDFLKRHSRVAKGTADIRCIRCHVDTDCTACHENHIHPGGSTGVPVPWTQTPEAIRP